MFHIFTNIEQTNEKKKKFFFISTNSSNETSSFVPKNLKIQNSQNQSFSKSSSINTQKHSKKITNNKKINKKKHIPMKKILFRLYRFNLINEKENEKYPKNLKKKGNFKLKIKLTKKTNISNNNKNYLAGRWKYDEHQRFIDAIIKYGNNWQQVQKYIGTRSSTQTRSHAQKFFEKLKRSKIFNEEKYDFSKNSLKILHDIMTTLSDKEYNLTLKALHSLSSEKNTDLGEEKNYFQNNDGLINFNDIYIENNENNNNNNYNENYFINDNNEENIKNLKFNNQGKYLLENNLCDNDDYMFYNWSYSGNINNFIYNNYLVNDNVNIDFKNYAINETNTYNQRKNSLFEMNLNKKEVKEQKNDLNDYNLDDKIENNYLNNNFYTLNIQQDNKKNINNIILENNNDKNEYNPHFENIDFSFSQQISRKISMEELIY